MHMVCKCTCVGGKHFKWSCVIHEYKKYLLRNRKLGDGTSPVIGGVYAEDTMTYSHYRCCMRKVATLLDLDKSVAPAS